MKDYNDVNGVDLPMHRIRPSTSSFPNLALRVSYSNLRLREKERIFPQYIGCRWVIGEENAKLQSRHSCERAQISQKHVYQTGTLSKYTQIS